MHNNEIMQMTDDRGRCVMSSDEPEPNPGSVVLVNGEFGMAWQRRFDDGLWHPTGNAGRGREWTWMLTHRNLTLVYDCAARPVHTRQLPPPDLDLPCPDCGYRFEDEVRLARHYSAAHWVSV